MKIGREGWWIDADIITTQTADKDNFYLCLQCGSGSKRNDGVQGKLCPKCGDSRMYISKFKLNNMYCPKCKHEINPPHKSL